MQVEITKMVYQHPRHVFLALHSSNDRLGGIFIRHIEKVAVGGETQLSATDRTRLVVPTVEHARRDRMHCRVRSHLRRSGTSLDMIGHCTLCIWSSSGAASGAH